MAGLLISGVFGWIMLTSWCNQFTMDTKLNPLTGLSALFSLLSIVNTFAISVFLFLLNRRFANSTNDKSLLLDHAKELIKCANSMHVGIADFEGQRLTDARQSSLAGTADDMIRHFDLIRLGVIEAGLRPPAGWLETTEAHCDDYREHCTSLSLGDVVATDFVAHERDFHLLYIVSLERLTYAIHRLN